MALDLFGFTISRKGEEKEEKNVKSFVPVARDDGAMEVSAMGGAYGTVVDLEGSAKNEADLVSKYRTMMQQQECDSAVEDIVNEAIIIEDESAVNIVLDNIDISKQLKNKIRQEFDNVLKVLDFSNAGYDIFKQWYVDGRLYYHIMIPLHDIIL